MQRFCSPSLRRLAKRAPPPWRQTNFAATTSTKHDAATPTPETFWNSLLTVTPVLSGKDIENYIVEGVKNVGEHLAWMQTNVDSGITKDMWSVESQIVFMQLRNSTLKEHDFDAKEFLGGASQAFRVIMEATMDKPPDADADDEGSEEDSAAADDGGGGGGSGSSGSSGSGGGGSSGSSGSGLADKPQAAEGATPSQAEGASDSLGTAAAATTAAAAAAKDSAKETGAPAAAAKGSDTAGGFADGNNSAEAKDPSDVKDSADEESSAEGKDSSAEGGRQANDELLRTALSPRLYTALTEAITEIRAKETRLVLLDLQVESASLKQASCFIYRDGKLCYGVRPEDRIADASEGEKALAVIDVEFRYRQQVRAEKVSGDEVVTRNPEDKETTWRFAAFLEDPQWRVVHIM